MTIQERLQSLSITLPKPAAAVANYVPYVISGSLVSVSGQIPMGPNGPAWQGKVGADIDIETAIEAARLCAINIIAQLNAATDGNLERVARIVKLGGFVNAIDGFTDQPKVINGASDLMVEVFGDVGRHSRSAVGVNSLPLGVPVEVDALVELT